VGNNSPTIDRIAINNQEEFIMKKSLVIGAATLAITAMVGTGFGYASSQNTNEESVPAKIATPAVEVTAEERAKLEKEALEVKGTPAVKTTPATKATAEEIAEFEKNATPAAKLIPATKATAEEIAEFEKNATPEEIAELKLKSEGTPAVKSTEAKKATAEEIAAREKEEAAKK